MNFFISTIQWMKCNCTAKLNGCNRHSFIRLMYCRHYGNTNQIGIEEFFTHNSLPIKMILPPFLADTESFAWYRLLPLRKRAHSLARYAKHHRHCITQSSSICLLPSRIDFSMVHSLAHHGMVKLHNFLYAHTSSTFETDLFTIYLRLFLRYCGF